MNARDPKILVAGGSGMLGATLVPILREQDYTVLCHTHGATGDCRADLTGKAETHRLLDEIAPDVVVNLVGLTNVDLCEKEPELARRLNVQVVENLASWPGFSQGCHLIQISTDHVYDGAGPFTESEINLKNI